MKKIVYLTESDLYRISKRIIQEEKIEIEEGIFDGISNIYQGLKGVWRGEGYDFFRYLNTLKNIAKQLKNLDAPNHKIMNKLTDLKNKVSASTMPQEKKGQLIFEIEKALKNFKEYSEHINNIDDIATQRLKGVNTYSETSTRGLNEPNPLNTTQNKLPQPIEPPSDISERRYRRY